MEEEEDQLERNMRRWSATAAGKPINEHSLKRVPAAAGEGCQVDPTPDEAPMSDKAVTGTIEQTTMMKYGISCENAWEDDVRVRF